MISALGRIYPNENDFAGSGWSIVVLSRKLFVVSRLRTLDKLKSMTSRRRRIARLVPDQLFAFSTLRTIGVIFFHLFFQHSTSQDRHEGYNIVGTSLES